MHSHFCFKNSFHLGKSDSSLVAWLITMYGKCMVEDEENCFPNSKMISKKCFIISKGHFRPRFLRAFKIVRLFSLWSKVQSHFLKLFKFPISQSEANILLCCLALEIVVIVRISCLTKCIRGWVQETMFLPLQMILFLITTTHTGNLTFKSHILKN